MKAIVLFSNVESEDARKKSESIWKPCRLLSVSEVATTQEMIPIFSVENGRQIGHLNINLQIEIKMVNLCPIIEIISMHSDLSFENVLDESSAIHRFSNRRNPIHIKKVVTIFILDAATTIDVSSMF